MYVQKCRFNYLFEMRNLTVFREGVSIKSESIKAEDISKVILMWRSETE